MNRQKTRSLEMVWAYECAMVPRYITHTDTLIRTYFIKNTDLNWSTAHLSMVANVGEWRCVQMPPRARATTDPCMLFTHSTKKVTRYRAYITCPTILWATLFKTIEERTSEGNQFA